MSRGSCPTCQPTAHSRILIVSRRWVAVAWRHSPNSDGGRTASLVSFSLGVSRSLPSLKLLGIYVSGPKHGGMIKEAFDNRLKVSAQGLQYRSREIWEIKTLSSWIGLLYSSSSQRLSTESKECISYESPISKRITPRTSL